MNKLIVLIALLAAIPSLAYTQVSSSSTTVAGNTRTETIVQDGSNSIDQFTMTRVRQTNSTPRGPILLLPGSNGNFELFEVETTGNYTDSFAGHMAAAGFDVWGYSPRTKQFADGDCAVSSNCTAALNWGLGTVAADAEYIRTEIEITTGQKPVIIGWSMGAMSAFAALDLNPTGYSGAVLWEGTIYSGDAITVAANYANCDATDLQLLLGETVRVDALIAGGGTISALKTVVATTSDPVRHLLLVNATTAGLYPPLSYTPNYTFFKKNNSLLAPDFQYDSEDMLIAALSGDAFNSYESLVVNRDIFCSLGGQDTTFVDDLISYDEPVFVIESSLGMGPYMADNIALLGTSTSDIDYNPYGSGFGHGDHYASSSHETYLEDPVENWLGNIFP